MGSTCSTIQTGGEIDISGNGNSAIIINGLRHNVSNMFNTAVNLITQKYRFELILIHFTSVLLMMIATLFIIRLLMPHSAVEKEIQSTLDKYELKLKMDAEKYHKDFKELDRALNEVERILINKNYALLYLAYPLEYIENIYNLVQSSPYLLSIVISKLIDKNYAGLCVAIFQLKNGNPRQCSETWQSITCALYGLCCYVGASSKLCILCIVYFSIVVSITLTAVDAGIIPVFASVLSQKSYLVDLDTNPSVMFLFQMVSRMLHSIVQIEKLKYNLENHNCCEILLNVVAHTNNRLLRAINLLTAVRITRDGARKVSFTNDDNSILFRLYYESVKSKYHEAYGLKQEHILNGFYAIGRLDCISHDFRSF